MKGWLERHNLKWFIRVIAVIMLVAVIMDGIHISQQIQVIEDAMYEKYGEGFTKVCFKDIGDIDDGVRNHIFYIKYKTTYDVDGSDLYFYATLNSNEDKVEDGFEKALLGKEISKEMSDAVSSVVNDYIIRSDVIDGAEGFRRGNIVREQDNDISCSIQLIINSSEIKDDNKIEDLYNKLEELYSYWGNVQGYVYTSVMQEDAFNKLKADYIMDDSISIHERVEKYSDTYRINIVDGEFIGEISDFKNTLVISRMH